ncbi:MAG: Gfo/Idh/MocA family oxidoreductase [Firmicutes bacterium]|nr:Gfo/Idh/MocA family oxidoreductase [Bacillota bacterium]
MDKVRIGVVGIGNMGTSHAKNLYESKVNNAVLTAVCDIKESRLRWAKTYFKGEVEVFDSFEAIIHSREVDALIIATPHYNHPSMGMETLKAGLHVLVEKPIGVYTKAVEELNVVAEKSDKIFTIMYNQRTNPIYQRVRKLIQDGEIGEITRVNWVITDWYRTQYYYDSGGWRATWKGEGGGVLLNQCPHQLDLVQWLCGMPKRIRGFCDYGKYHQIEVEDDVTAFFQYENGATGTFITCTGEAPGTNRLEISGDKGKLVVEKDGLLFYRNVVKTSEHCANATVGFEMPENWVCKIPVEGESPEHVGIMQSFVDAILHGKEQLALGIEGIRGLTISNAIHLSSWLDDWVTLPINSHKFHTMLQDKIKHSMAKESTEDVVLDVQGSH